MSAYGSPLEEVGLSNYLIDIEGNVWVKYKHKTVKLTGTVTDKGYRKYHLKTDEGKHKKFLGHRLVALVFIPNPCDKLEVNHKDGDKLNNHISNLEWCTHSENVQHAYDNNLINISGVLETPPLRDS